jgi:hypothetical protein
MKISPQTPVAFPGIRSGRFGKDKNLDRSGEFGTLGRRLKDLEMEKLRSETNALSYFAEAI